MSEVLDKLSEKKRKLDEQKKKLNDLEFRERLKKKKQNLVILRKLLDKTNLMDTFSNNHQALEGAFIELSELAKDNKNVTRWINLAESSSLKSASSFLALAISFKNHPSNEVREKLKALKFKWNGFRKEYYGFGDKKEIEKLLSDTEAKIESL